MSWGWRKLLQLCDLVRPYIWAKVGDGFHLKNHVADLIENNTWMWPQAWLQKAPNLGLLAALNHDVNSDDTYCFSTQVWMQVRTMADMDNIQPALHDINERNNRLFKKEKRSSDELRNIIMVMVRLKLMTFRFKNTTNVQQMHGKWKMPSSFRLYGESCTLFSFSEVLPIGFFLGRFFKEAISLEWYNFAYLEDQSLVLEAKTHEENPNVGKTQEENPKSVLESVQDKPTGWDDDDNNRIKSFANVVSASTPKSKLNFRTQFNEDKVEETDFVLPLAAVEVVKHKFDNTLVGFFVGQKVAFPLVKNYIMNTWSKFGVQKVMRDDEGVYYYKFDSPNGVDQVLQQGPWMIRNTPLILNKWTPNLSLAKDKVTKVPVWVKLHRVPVVAYSEDGLNLIASQVGTPLMLDAFTSTMCEEPWGRIRFMRALIEVSAEKDLKDNVIMAVPLENGEGYSKENIRVEYEWKLPTCSDCRIFGHYTKKCPQRPVKRAPVVVKTTMEENNDGFVKVNNRKSKGKGPMNNQKKNATGFKVGNNQNLRYQPVKPKSSDKKSDDDQQDNGIKLKNLFEKLNDITIPVIVSSRGNEAENIFGDTSKVTQFTEDSDSEVEETLIMETKRTKGASTPNTQVSNV
ncbi:retrovirus-related pol polyprotein from transposon TNT 1-94 [Tanacetum coccineum]